MVTSAIFSLGLVSIAQAQVLTSQATPEIAVQSANADYDLLLVGYPSESKTISLPSPYFYVGSYIYPLTPNTSPDDIKVEAERMSTDPIKISYVGPLFTEQSYYYRLTIQAGTPGGSTVTNYTCDITVQPF